MIDNEATNELDYSNLHIALLAAEVGLELEGDAYDFPEQIHPGIPKDQQRSFVKSVILAAINAKSEDKTFRAVNDSRQGRKFDFKISKKMVLAVIDAFKDRYPLIAPELCTGAGLRLMYKDSEIASLIIKAFVARDEPVLVVHDSFIVRASQVPELEKELYKAAQAVAGKTIEFTAEKVLVSENDSIHLSPTGVPGLRQQRMLQLRDERYGGCIGYNQRHQNWKNSRTLS